MRRRSGTGGGPDKSRGRTAITRKRRKAPKAVRISSAAKKVESATKTEVTQLALELQEARERQAATAEVLSLISDSPTDLLPVFDRIVKNAARLCQSVLSAVYRRDGDHVHLVAHDQFSPESVAAVRKAYPAPLTSQNLISVAIRERRSTWLAGPGILRHNRAHGVLKLRLQALEGAENLIDVRTLCCTAHRLGLLARFHSPAAIMR